MRIGFFTDTFTPQINGVVTSIKLFREALERQGHTVYVFAPTPRQPTDGPHVIRIPSVPFAFQPEYRLAAIYSQHAYNLVRRANLDIIHSHDPFAIGLFGLSMAKRFRIPYIHTYHTLYPEYVHYIWETEFTREMAERLSKQFCEQCDVVIAPSTKINRALTEWGVRTSILTLPTGVDTGRFAQRDPEAIAAFRERFHVPAGDRLLAFVGRLGTEKNVDLLVDALAQVKAPGARLLIVGDGPYRHDLVKHIERANVGDRVTFTGYLGPEDVRSAYQASEALFFASTSETQGLVVAEAMAAGLPVVAVDDLAIADAVTEGVNGFLVPERPEALADAVDRLLCDPSMQRAMAAASLERAHDLSIDRQAEKLVGVYEAQVATKPRPRRTGDRRRRMTRRVLRQLTVLRRGGNRLVRRYL